MRHVLRLIANTVCVLSLFAGLFLVGLWIRSYRVGETWHFGATAAPPAHATPLTAKPDTWVYQYHLACGDGQVQLVRRNMATSDVKQLGYRRVDPPAEALIHLEPGGNSGGSGWRFAQFEYFHSGRRTLFVGTMSAWIWGFLIGGVPLWLPAVALAVPPVAWVIRRRQTRRRLRTGLCSGCGYDLRASREFGRCPECGRATAAAPAPSAPASPDPKHADVTSPGPTPTS